MQSNDTNFELNDIVVDAREIEAIAEELRSGTSNLVMMMLE